jgi:dihydrofolate reductase
MTIIMVVAISLDGFITSDSSPGVYSWTSAEDKQFFTEIKSKHRLFIMGRLTYESASIKPEPGILRIVMTKNPDMYRDKEVVDQLEFTDMSVTEIVQKYQKLYDSCLVLGGSEIYEEFINNNLVDEIYLTVEPIVHKSGTPMLKSGKKISDVTQDVIPDLVTLNSVGTILEHYVLKK